MGLAFPFGTAPGFDPSHIVGAAATLAAIPCGANFVDLLTGRPGTVTGTPAASVIAGLGSCIKFGGGTDNIGITGKKTFGANAAPLNDTMAAIVQMTSSAAQQAFLALGTNGTDSTYSYLSTAGANATMNGGHQSLTGAASSWVGAINVPVFAAFSQNLTATTGATQTANIVVSRLDTGFTIANSTTNAGYSCGSRNGTFNIGSRGASSQPSTAYIAAVMASDAFHSLAELTKWAADPWSFWYPDVR